MGGEGAKDDPFSSERIEPGPSDVQHLYGMKAVWIADGRQEEGCSPTARSLTKVVASLTGKGHDDDVLILFLGNSDRCLSTPPDG